MNKSPMPTRTRKRKPKRPPHVEPGFAERFRNARIDAGLPPSELSALTNGLVSVRSIFDWEHEQGYPRLGAPIRAASEVLEEPLAWLLRGDASARARADDGSDDSRGSPGE